jgi:hypothetical protein
MLRNLADLQGYEIRALDGDIGSIADFLFDDERWVVRYLVAKTGGFFSREHVLISPISFREVDWSARRFHLALSKEQVENSPNIDVDRPVSRQRERELHGYYGYALYWGYPGLWGVAGYPGMLATNRGERAASTEVAQRSEPEQGDIHLRSASEVRSYDVVGRDESIGHIEDFIADDTTWAIRYLVIDTSNWWFGKKVLVAPEWAKRISWDSKSVSFDLTRDQIENSPAWKPTQAIQRAYGARLYDHYGRPGYWV